MAVDEEEIQGAVDHFTGTEAWKNADNDKRRSFVRNFAIAGKKMGAPPDLHDAVTDRLYSEASHRGLASRAGSFVGSVIKFPVEAGTAAALAASDTAGLTDSGTKARVVSGVTQLGDTVKQRVKQIAPNDEQEKRDQIISLFKKDIDEERYPSGLKDYLSGEGDPNSPEYKEAADYLGKWQDLTLRSALKASGTDPDAPSPYQPKGATMTLSNLMAEKSSGSRGLYDPRGHELLADYLATRDPGSWQGLQNLATEDNTQYSNRLKLSAKGASIEDQAEMLKNYNQEHGGKKELTTLDELALGAMNIQSDPVAMALAGLPLLRGIKALKAATAGAVSRGTLAKEMAKSAAHGAVVGAALTAGHDPRTTGAEIAEGAVEMGLGTAGLTGVMTGVGKGLRAVGSRFRNEEPSAESKAGPEAKTEGSPPEEKASTAHAEAADVAEEIAIVPGAERTAAALKQISESPSTPGAEPKPQTIQTNGIQEEIAPQRDGQGQELLTPPAGDSFAPNASPEQLSNEPGSGGAPAHPFLPDEEIKTAPGQVEGLEEKAPEIEAPAPRATESRESSSQESPSESGDHYAFGETPPVLQDAAADVGQPDTIEAPISSKKVKGQRKTAKAKNKNIPSESDEGFTWVAEDLQKTVPKEELSREAKTYSKTAFDRAMEGDETAFDDMEAEFRDRHPREPVDMESKDLSKSGKVWTPEAFENLFEGSFKAKDYDSILEAVKQSDRGVWAPFIKKLFKQQASDPEAAAKAEWMRHIFAGTTPADAVKAAPGPAPTGAPPPRPGSPPPKSSSPPPKPPPPPPRIPVNPITGKPAKAPYRIINDFSKAIGKALHIRRLRPTQLGVYRPGDTLTAQRFASDLDTAAHELAGHWVDDKYGIGKPWLGLAEGKAPFDAELEKFWIHGSPSPDIKIRRAEGVAEYARARIMDPAAAKAQAPKFTTEFESKLPKKALDAIDAFGEDVRTYAGEDPRVKAALHINDKHESAAERFVNAFRGDERTFGKTPLDVLKTWFIDKNHVAIKGWKHALAMLGKDPESITPKEDVELKMALINGLRPFTEDQWKNGLQEWEPNIIEGSKGELKEVARIKDKVTGETVSGKWLFEPLDQSSVASMEKESREVSGFMVAQRTLEKAKLIDQEAAKEIAAHPGRRASILSEAEARKRNLSGLGAGLKSDVEAARETIAAQAKDPARAKRITEAARRYRVFADSLLQMMEDSGRMSKDEITKIRKENEYYVAMQRLSEEFDQERMARTGSGSLGTSKEPLKRFKGSSLEIQNPYESIIHQMEVVIKEINRNDVIRSFVDPLIKIRGIHDGPVVELEKIASQATKDDRNTVRVWRKGIPEYWKMDKDIHASLKNLGDLGSHPFIELLSIPQQIARYLITHSPAFVTRNVLRDTAHRAVVSHSGNVPWDILKGYSQQEKSNLSATKGANFGNYATSRLKWNKMLRDTMNELAPDKKNIFMLPHRAWETWAKTAGASETLGRVSEQRSAYRYARTKLGYSPDEAAMYAAGESRGLMDYAKAGTVMQAINKLIPFSNAAVRGLTRSMEGFQENPSAFLMRWGLYVLTPTVLTMAWNYRDPETREEYSQLPSWQRDFFWNFKIGHHWLRIPKPHELGVMAGGVERALEKTIYGQEEAFSGYGKSAATAFVPVGSATEAMGPMKVPAEIIFNRDTFRDRDIIPSWERDLKLELRKGTSHASAPGKAVGNALSIDPRYVDHILNSYGGLGQMFTSWGKENLLESALKTSGYTTHPPGNQSEHYQKVMDFSREYNRINWPPIEQLHKLSSAVFDAKTPEEADKAALRLRQRSKEVWTRAQAIMKQEDARIKSSKK